MHLSRCLHVLLVAMLMGVASAEVANKPNAYGVTPLVVACERGDVAAIRMLLDAGADANTTLTGGESALMVAARTGKPEPVKLLLAKGARLEAQDRKGQTSLMWAAAEGHTEVVQMLIAAGANVRAQVKSGFTALLFAAREGRIGAAKALLDAGVDVNEAVTKEKTMSALLLAEENGHFELGVMLLEAGANPNDERSGYTPLHSITWVRKPNRGDGEDGNPPPQGSGKVTSLEFVRALVQHGAKVNALRASGSGTKAGLSLLHATPFLMASKTADLPLMQFLVELGADPQLPNADGVTPLLAAAGLGTAAPDEEAGTEDECVAAVRWLLDRGADINIEAKNGETAMHGAAYKNLPQMVAFLASRGARIETWNHKNKSGWTPLMIAEGFRPGNFKPSAETIAAIHQVMRASGVTPPPPTPRDPALGKGYGAKKSKR